MAFHDEPGPDRVMFCSVGYARGPETRVYMDGSDAGLSRGEVVAALNGWVVDKDEADALRDHLRRAEAEIERLRGIAEADNSHAMSTAANGERLAARIAELERMVVWLADKVDCVTLPSTGGRKTVRFESFALGVKVIPTDGTPAGILAAVKEAMGDA